MVNTKKMNSKILIAALLSTLLTASGCRLILQQMKPNFFAGNGAFTAAQAVRNKVGSSFKVRRIEITEEKFTMSIESPANPRNIDEYTYIGVAAVGPKPLPFDPYDAREVQKMPLDEIDFTVIPQVAQNALEKAQIEGGKIKEITFFTKVGEKFGWDVNVQGTRESAWVSADMKGNIVGTNLSQTARAADYKVIGEAELTKASDAIRAKFGADAQLADLHINERSVSFKAKNPNNSQEVYSYTFGIDGLKKANPVALPPSIMSDYATFKFAQMNLADVVALSRRAKEKLGMPNGEIKSIDFTSFPTAIDKPVSDRLPGVTMKAVSFEPRWTVEVRDGTDEGRVQYDAKLNEIPADKK